MGRRTDEQIDWQTGRQTVRLGLTVRQTNWETGRHTDLEKGRKKDRQTHRQKDIDRQTERWVERLYIIDLEARYRQKRLLSCEKADQNTQLIKGKTNRTKDIKKKTCSPKTISFTRATWVPNTFSARHSILPWSKNLTFLISSFSLVTRIRPPLPWILLCKEHVIFGTGLPEAEIRRDKLFPSLTEIEEGILEENRGGAVGRWE